MIDAKIVKDFAGAGVRLATDTLNILEDVIKGAIKDIGNEIISHRELSYEEVMKYFLDHQNDKPEIAKGALLKEETENGFLIIQVFLDKDQKLVEGEMGRLLGCKTRVGRLDGELLNLFKNENLVVVE
jgi:hypothetical protein